MSPRPPNDELAVDVTQALDHIRGLLRRLGVHTRLEAVVRGYRLGLLTPRRDD
jgi:DNA-binding CsgD family transcriptional regulator